METIITSSILTFLESNCCIYHFSYEYCWKLFKKSRQSKLEPSSLPNSHQLRGAFIGPWQCQCSSTASLQIHAGHVKEVLAIEKEDSGIKIKSSFSMHGQNLLYMTVVVPQAGSASLALALMPVPSAKNLGLNRLFYSEVWTDSRLIII